MAVTDLAAVRALSLSNGYSAGGTLGGGNIQLHKAMPIGRENRKGGPGTPGPPFLLESE